MKFSTNTIAFKNQQYGSAGNPAPDGIDALLEKIGAQLGGVEEVIPFGERFNGALIVKVVECRKHENSDHLNVCKIDDGGKAQNVERDDQGHVQVICGAPNVREGLTVVWLPPGTTVPESFVKGEPFVLESRELRGEMSNGMLASARELTIGDSHDGILEIITDSDEHIEPGVSFADQYHLNGDVVIDIENKMFTHRPDCFGWMGVARELEGIQGRPYKSPEWYVADATIQQSTDAEPLPLEVRNELPELVPRFTAITMCDIQIHDSPLWLQLDLTRAGMRPLNNIVDYTNFFMLETGQPLHAYDYDKVRALCDADHAVLTVRRPQAGEKIALLNGKEVEPRAEAIMIATDKQLIGIAGVMGGADTEVDANTHNIIIECATFDMYSIRKTSMAHGLFTDAVTRFSKGQSPLQNKAVACKIADEIVRFAGGKVVGLVDDNHVDEAAMSRGSLHEPVVVRADFINARLGSQLSADDMALLLRNVEFKIGVADSTLTVAAPFWRTDIEIAEDVVEEIGRLYGFDRLPLELPKRDIMPATKSQLLELKGTIRDTLARAGANEVLTYSFVHGNLLDKVGQSREEVFQLSNALSPDLQYYRPSLTPSLLDKIHANVKAGYDEFALFEMSKTHEKEAMDKEGLPLEFDNLALIYTTNKSGKPGAAYYEAQKFLSVLVSSLGHTVAFKSIQNHIVNMDAPFDLARSAVIYIDGSDQGIGIVGEFTASVRKDLKLPVKTAGFELGIGSLLGKKTAGSYASLSKFPKIEQDVCLKVSKDLSYRELYDFVVSKLSEIALPATSHSLSPVDIYQREDDPEHKQITFRLSIASHEKTLRDEEVSRLLDQVVEAAHQKFQAERI